MSYWQLYYHVVWATQKREPAIRVGLEPGLYACLRDKAIELGTTVHALGGVEDHVHAVLSIPPRIAVASCVGQLKGASSHWANHLPGYSARLEWQEGYGVFSFSARSLPSLARYVLDQRRRHEAGRLVAALERIPGQALRLHCGRPLDGTGPEAPS